MQGQGLALHSHHIPELRVMLLDDLIEKCLFRSMTLIRCAVWRPIRELLEKKGEQMIYKTNWKNYSQAKTQLPVRILLPYRQRF